MHLNFFPFEYGVKSRIAEFLEHCMSAYQKVKNMQKRKSLYDLTFQIDLSLKKTFGIIMIHIIE